MPTVALRDLCLSRAVERDKTAGHGTPWGEEGPVACLWVVGWPGGQSGMAVSRANGGRNDPGLPSRPSRTGRISGLHSGAEPRVRLQARLVLHAEEPAQVPGVRPAAQVPPWLRCGHTRYGVGLLALGSPLGLSFTGISSSAQPLNVVSGGLLSIRRLIRYLLCARPWGSRDGSD